MRHSSGTVQCGPVEIAYESFGDEGDRPLLLVMGLATQMLAWHDEFCASLVERGFFVVRFDNRDVGLSTHLHDAPPPDVMAALGGDTSSASYSLEDCADDAVGLLDGLGITRRVHVVGASMGGMIAQTLAIRHPERVASLTSIMSTPSPRIGAPTQAATATLFAPPATNRDEAVQRALSTYRVIGSPAYPLDEAWLSDVAGRAYDRAYDPLGVARQLLAIHASGDRTRGAPAARPADPRGARRGRPARAGRRRSCDRSRRAGRRARWSSPGWATTCRATCGRGSSTRSRAGRPRRGAVGGVRVLMIAPPGAGKGTQGVVIAEHFGIPHIATGDLLRDHVARGTELGKSVQDFLDRGELVPDEVVLDMVRTAFEELQGDGYVLDGVPRTMEQARALYEIAVELDMRADVALHLKVEDAELVRRLLARAQDTGRSDDTEDVIRHRLALYYDVTHPIVEWYGERGILVTVDANREADAVGRQILTALEVLRQVIERDDGTPRKAVDLTGLGAAFGARSV